jgi:hypothetical protein
MSALQYTERTTRDFHVRMRNKVSLAKQGVEFSLRKMAVVSERSGEPLLFQDTANVSLDALALQD